MGLIRYSQPIAKGPPPERRSYDEVLGVVSSSSPRGSTYHKRLWRCPREHALNAGGLRRALPPSEHLTVGLMIHRALEHYYAGRVAVGKRLGLVLASGGAQVDDLNARGEIIGMRSVGVDEAAAWASIVAFSEEPGYEQTWAMVQRMLVGYFELYRDTERKWKIWAVEETLGFIHNGFEWTGRLDGLIERDGGLWILEHKCLAGDSILEVFGQGGVPVRKLVGTQPWVDAYDVERRQFVRAKAWVEENGRRNVWRVRFDNGQSLRATGNHPVLTSMGWKAVKGLQIGDWVATPCKLGVPSVLTPLPSRVQIAALVGYFLGDGGLTGETMRFTKTNPRVLREVRRLLSSFGWAGSTRIDPRNGVPTLGALAPFKHRLDGFGLRGCGAADKFIPREFFSDPLEVQRALLGALWSTDGCVSVSSERRFGKTWPKVQLAYSSVSEQLATDVRELAHRCGYVATLCKTSVLYRGVRRPVWNTKIVGRESRRAFLLALRDGLLPSPKYVRNSVIARALKALHAGGDDLPVPLGWLGREGVAKAVAAGLRLRPGQRSVEGGFFTRMGLPHPSPDLVWVQVKSALIEAREMTYAVTVPGPSTHVTDGIITHNTARQITQDILSGYQMDPQMLGYVWLLKNVLDLSKLPPVAGIIVNILTKHATPKYERVEVCPSRYHLAEFEKTITQRLRLREQFKVLGWPKILGNCTGAARYFSTCDYFDLCHGRPEASAEQLLAEEPPFGFTKIDLDALDPDEVA